jgi:hypothetical protein
MDIDTKKSNFTLKFVFYLNIESIFNRMSPPLDEDSDEVLLLFNI